MTTSEKTVIYLSASVANAPLNLKLRSFLPEDEFELVLPQEFTPQVAHKELEREIFEQCIEQMERSSVGLLLLDAFAIDCAMESGWYHAHNKPLVGIANSTARWTNNWMVKGALTHCVTMEKELFPTMQADPVMKGHAEVRFLETWEALAGVMKDAAAGWPR